MKMEPICNGFLSTFFSSIFLLFW